MGEGHEQASSSSATRQDQASDEEMRAAYEAELNRITSSEMILQTAVSLLNIGGRRLGLAPAAAGSADSPMQAERDLEQVRDAIDGASALLPILERRMPRELGPLRDAVAQLQLAYAREASASAAQNPQEAAAASGVDTSAERPEAQDSAGAPNGGESSQDNAEKRSARESSSQEKDTSRPGPAQASGRLWVPGR